MKKLINKLFSISKERGVPKMENPPPPPMYSIKDKPRDIINVTPSKGAVSTKG